MSHTPPTARAPGVTDNSDKARLARVLSNPDRDQHAYMADRGDICINGAHFNYAWFVETVRDALAHPPAAEREAPGGVVAGWPDADDLGAPLNPEQDGWHWVAGAYEGAKPEPWGWNATDREWTSIRSSTWDCDEVEAFHYYGPIAALAAAPSPPAAGHCGGDGAREPVLVVPCGASNPLGTVPDRPSVEAIEEVLRVTIQRHDMSDTALYWIGGNAPSEERTIIAKAIKALLAAPAEGGRDG